MKKFFKFLIKTIIFFTILIVPISYEDQLGENYWIVYSLIVTGLVLWVGRGILILLYKAQHGEPPTTDALINMAKKPSIFFSLLVICIYGMSTTIGSSSTLGFFIIFLLFCGLIMWLIRGLWRSFWNPPSQESWRFHSSKVGPREEWLKEIIRDLKFKKKQHHKSNKLRKEKKVQAKIDKYNNELDRIRKEYSEVIKDYQTEKRAEKEYNKALREVTKEYDTIGVHSPKVICPHCSEKGNVWRNDNATTEEKSQEAGVIGAVIGKKTITKKQVTQMHCKNCSTSWVV